MRKLLFAMICLSVAACGKTTPQAAEVSPATPFAELDSAPPSAPPDTEAASSADVAVPDVAVAAPDVAAVAQDVALVAPDAAPAPDAVAAGADVADAAPVADVAAAPDAASNLAGAVMKLEPTAPPKPFADMSEKEQKEHMKKVVTPVMRERFQAFDPKDFAKVKCATCHGEGAVEGKFEMPNPKLPKLPKTPEGFKKLAAKEPEAMAFMKDVVTPAMATMLGEPLYDPATKKGFGCTRCHTSE